MKRKIAFISEHASPLAALGGVDSGGQNVYVAQLAKHLAMLGYEVDVFTRWDDARFPQIIEWVKDVRVIHIKAGPIKFVRKEELLQHMNEFARNMLEFSEKEKHPYRLIHAHFWMSALVALKIKKTLKIPVVVTFHGLGKVRVLHQGKADQFPGKRFKIEEQIVREADQIIAECPQDKEDLLEMYNADPGRISIIPCGVDPHEFHPIDKILARALLGLDPKERLILQLGRMVPRKGIDNVIRGLSLLVKQHRTPARLVVVGGESDSPDPECTPEIGRLMHLAKQLGVAKRVKFVGRKNRESLKYYFSAADVFVSTPWYEPFGITPLEAMACGTPVIGSNVGGIKYTVLDGKTGYLVPPKQPEVLAQKLAELFRNRKLMEFYRQNAIKRVQTNFTWTKVAHSVSTLYERLSGPALLESADEESRLAIIDRNFESAFNTLKQARQLLRIPVFDAATSMAISLGNDRKVLVCGNGGSSAQASHFAAELVGRFQQSDRPAQPVISLSADSAVLTAWSNDANFDRVFSRQVEALGRPGDVLLVISTSGRSPNLLEALRAARAGKLITVALVGRGGGEAAELADIAIVVPDYDTQRIQETHLVILHTMCEIIETQLAASPEGEARKAALEDLLSAVGPSHELMALGHGNGGNGSRKGGKA